VPSRRRRHQPRFSVWTFVAPVALVAAVLLVVSVARPLLHSTPARTTVATAPTAATLPTSTAAAGARKRRRKLYVVQPGDTLSAIGRRFGVTQARLLALNPSLDPLALKPGQKVRIS
jgi:LysM repeat protein